MKTLIEITSQGMPPNYVDKIKELKSHLKRLYDKNNFPEDASENLRHAMLMEMDKKPDTYLEANEMWNTRWVLDEMRNIQASIDEIGIALDEYKLVLQKQKLEQNGTV